MAEQILASIVVIALLAGGCQWLRRRASLGTGLTIRRAARTLQVVERVPLSPHHSLHLVRHGNRALLIAVSPGGCALLESREHPVSGVLPGENA